MPDRIKIGVRDQGTWRAKGFRIRIRIPRFGVPLQVLKSHRRILDEI